MLAIRKGADAQDIEPGDERADGNGRGGVSPAVALGDHGRAEDARFHRGIGDRRTGDAAHQRREDDRDLRRLE